MAIKKQSEIIQEIETHIQSNGCSFAGWYVGITENPKVRLFKQHRLREKGDGWICRRTYDREQALEIMEYFRTVRQLSHIDTTESNDAVYIYAYRMKAHTSP